MSKKVVVVRYESTSLPKKEKVGIISESPKEISTKRENLSLMIKLIELEKALSKKYDIHYELELVKEDELEIENLNKELNGLNTITQSMTFDFFLIKYARKIQNLAHDTSGQIRTIEDVVHFTSALRKKLYSCSKL